MKRIAKFQKVSYEQFTEGWIDTFGATNAEEIKTIYDHIKLPKRATLGSAGYDFCSTVAATLQPGEMLKIPTGIRCEITDGWVLKCYPRSSLGFKYCLNLVNQAGIIDSDYFFSDNEGHIFMKFKNNGNMVVNINEGDKIAQGIFVKYGITVDDNVMDVINGGIGSTGV